MAITPSQEDVAKILDQNQHDQEEKLEAQIAEGKTFNVPADGHGPGVVPEETWKDLPGKRGNQ